MKKKITSLLYAITHAIKLLVYSYSYQQFEIVTVVLVKCLHLALAR